VSTRSQTPPSSAALGAYQCGPMTQCGAPPLLRQQIRTLPRVSLTILHCGGMRHVSSWTRSAPQGRSHDTHSGTTYLGAALVLLGLHQAQADQRVRLPGFGILPDPAHGGSREQGSSPIAPPPLPERLLNAYHLYGRT
jgi:hypothetical protein